MTSPLSFVFLILLLFPAPYSIQPCFNPVHDPPNAHSCLLILVGNERVGIGYAKLEHFHQISTSSGVACIVRALRGMS